MIEQKNLGYYSSKIITHTILIILSIVCIMPFLLIISTSISSQEGINMHGYTFFPTEICFDSYKYVLANPEQIINSYMLTIFVTVTGTICGMFLMSSFAYTISRKDYKFRAFLSFFIYFTMLFNGGMVANYIWVSKYLGLANNKLVLILPLLMSSYNIFILRIYCQNIPASLIESAKIEGASEFRIFFSIVIPLAKTGIATITLLTVFAFWNEWFSSMMYMDSSKDTTIQYYLVKVLNNVEFAKTHSSSMATTLNVPNETVRMAICAIAAGPMAIIFPFFQKYFVKGIVVGSVKG